MPLRHIPLPSGSMLNLRDLGGYATRSGGQTAFGRFFRSDVPIGLTQEDEAVLRSLSIGTVIDLRTDEERASKPCALASWSEVDYHPLCLSSGDVLPTTSEEASQLYWSMITRPEIADILRAIAQAKPGAVLFHCMVGKDRTGLVAALLLLLAGVRRDDILADYQVSYTYLRHRLRAILASFTNVPTTLGRSEIGFLEPVLVRIDDEHGGAASFLAALGMSKADIEALAARLIE